MDSKTELPISFKTFTFDEAIQYIKAHPDKFKDSDMGLTLLKLIKEGNSKRLKRYWIGMR